MARSFAQLGRLPEGPMSEIDLREMLTQLVATHTSERPHAEVHLPRDLPLIRGHYDALSRVFRNLLLNALDAVQGQANPEVRVSAELTDGSVRVRVTDTGPGIDPAIFDRIWDPDFTTKSRGTGLGLALVRQTVRAHGGDVEARNVSGGGAEFVVTLPIEPTPGLDSAGAGPETGGAL
jgi:signal transduction histidine kinase